MLTPESANIPIALPVPPKGIQFYSKGAIFYGYNAESVRDYNWGCAWRAIQTSLSGCGLNPSFLDLFHLFGPIHNLEKIYQDKYPHEKLPLTHPFAPYDLSSGWAEPFIGHMVMHFYGMPSVLETVNGIPECCNAPHSVFHNNPLTSTDFLERIKSHFENGNRVPIMIDDGIYAMAIIGIGCHETTTSLWIADPHIQEGVNLSADEKAPNGIYTIDLNHRGEQIRCSLHDEDRHQIPHMYREDSYNGLHFNEKKWMALFPNHP